MFRRLDFDGADPVFHRRVLVRFNDEEVDLHAVRRVVAVAARVEEQPVPVGPEKLCDDVLREHALVDFDAFQEDVPVQVASGLFRVGQGESGEKSGVGGVAFDRRMVLANA